MQSAPSVVYPVGRSVFEGRALVLMALLLLATMAGALVTADAPVAAWVGAAVALTAWMAWAWRDAKRAPQGWLRWQASVPGQAAEAPGGWIWQPSLDDSGTAVRRIEPVLDLQSRWLLRLDAPDAVGVPRWLWVEASRAPAGWLALRRALMQSRQGC